MKKRQFEPAHVRASSMHASEFLIGYLKPDGLFSTARRDELQKVLREELGSREQLGKIVRGAHGALLRRELMHRIRERHCRTTSVRATDIIMAYIRPSGVFSSAKRDELQAILRKEIGSKELLGRIVRGTHGTDLRLQLAERIERNRNCTIGRSVS